MDITSGDVIINDHQFITEACFQRTMFWPPKVPTRQHAMMVQRPVAFIIISCEPIKRTILKYGTEGSIHGSYWCIIVYDIVVRFAPMKTDSHIYLPVGRLDRKKYVNLGIHKVMSDSYLSYFYIAVSHSN